MDYSKNKDSNFLIAKTLQGLETVLAQELTELGAENIKTEKRAVSFSGNKETIYKANLHLRTALNIMIHINSFEANNENELYEKALDVEWEKYISRHKTFAISYTVNSAFYKHSQFAALKLKDAIVDRFRKLNIARPNVNKDNPDVKINLHISHNKVNVSIDTSGESLYKRGYKKITGDAPLSEVLAAGLVLLSGWDKKSALYDPMCGSGTIAIEAAMMAANIPAGLFRNEFGFMNHVDFDEGLWQRIHKESIDSISELKADIQASDLYERNVGKSKANALALKRYLKINFYKADFFSGNSKFVYPGTLIFNPPYGERLIEGDRIDFYKKIGSALKHHYNGSTAWILSSNKEALKHVGLKPSQKINLINGQLECVFAKFDLYEGSRKNKIQ